MNANGLPFFIVTGVPLPDPAEVFHAGVQAGSGPIAGLVMAPVVIAALVATGWGMYRLIKWVDRILNEE